MKSNGKVIFALLAGAAAGAALGLLLAPKKGSESRKAIADAAKNLVDSLGIRERFEDVTGMGSSNSGRNGSGTPSGTDRTSGRSEASSVRSDSTTASEAGRSRSGQTA
jgi:gas vesicle protein